MRLKILGVQKQIGTAGARIEREHGDLRRRLGEADDEETSREIEQQIFSNALSSRGYEERLFDLTSEYSDWSRFKKLEIPQLKKKIIQRRPKHLGKQTS